MSGAKQTPAASMTKKECVMAALNGQPGELTSALGLMMSLEQQAKDMMSGLQTGGKGVGPSFEYVTLL